MAWTWAWLHGGPAALSGLPMALGKASPGRGGGLAMTQGHKGPLSRRPELATTRGAGGSEMVLSLRCCGL